MFDVLSDSYQRVVHNSRLSGSFFATQRGQFAARQSIDIEIRGPVVLKWLVTCFSAVATLMMQGTACVRLDGLVDSNFFGNWIYDGRVSCFSNSGEAPGLWQVASVFGVALVIIAPAALYFYKSCVELLGQKNVSGLSCKKLYWRHIQAAMQRMLAIGKWSCKCC